MKRVALYVRVSSQEQKLHGLSVDSQIVALKEYAKEHNYQVVDIYNDAGFSARKSYRKRPELNRMVKDCQAKRIDLILMTKLDRFFRSVSDYYEVMSQIGDIPWRTIWEDYETETSSGVFKVNIMLSVAQSEADRTGERIKAVYDYKRAQGYYIGKAPFGYKINNHHLIKDLETAPFVELMFKTYLRTFSTTKTIETLVEAGSPYTNANGIRKRLKSETYCGNANGHECEPYITLEQHQTILEHFEHNTRNTTPKNTYIFAGLLTCSQCGCRLHSKANFQSNGELCKFYVCDGKTNTIKHSKRTTISERKVERYLRNSLTDELYKYNLSVDAGNNNEAVEGQIQALKGKLERIGVRFELGDITIEDYKAKREAINEQIRTLEFQKKPVRKINLPEDWELMYDDLTDESKHSFFASIIKDIVVDKTEKEPTYRINWID